MDPMRGLIINADDYGLNRAYDEGIVEAAAVGALDAASAFGAREALGAGPLLDSGVEIGLHLDLEAPGDAPRATADDRRAAGVAILEQIERFAHLFGRPPAYLDGHKHCHARAGLGVVVAEIAADRDLPVRSIDSRHRRLLRCRGVATTDLLVGRLEQSQPALPAELTPAGLRLLPDDSVVEWMVHPGHRDPSSGSSYDAGRGEDLSLLLDWRPPAGIERTTHVEAHRG